MKSWRDGRLGDFLELKRGYDLPKAARADGPHPIVSSSGPSGFHAEARVRAPGVVTGRYGTIGEVFYLEQDFWPLNTTLYVRDFKSNDPRFVSYFLRCFDFGVYSDKAAVPGINRNHVHEARVRLPDPAEQRTIASVLGALDDKIELNRRMNETLEGLVRTLYRRTRNAASAYASIYDYATVSYGAAFASSLFNGRREGMPLIRIRDLATFEPEVWTTEEHAKATVIEPGDLVVGMDGEFRPRIWQGKRALLNQRVCSFRPQEGVPIAFLWQAIRDDLAFYEQAKTGTTVIHLGKADIDRFTVPALAAATLAEFGEQTDPLAAKLVANANETRTLAELRDALLPKLISGELRVRDAEAALEAAEQ